MHLGKTPEQKQVCMMAVVRPSPFLKMLSLSVALLQWACSVLHLCDAQDILCKGRLCAGYSLRFVWFFIFGHRSYITSVYLHVYVSSLSTNTNHCWSQCIPEAWNVKNWIFSSWSKQFECSERTIFLGVSLISLCFIYYFNNLLINASFLSHGTSVLFKRKSN